MQPLLAMCLGYLAAIIHIVVDVVGLSCVQMLQGEIPDFELSVIRIFLQTCLLGIIGKCNRNLQPIPMTDFKWMGLAMLGFLCCNAGYYGSGKCMPLANHGSLGYFITMITLVGLNVCLQNEPPGMMNMLTMVTGFTGIVMATQPSFLFHTNNLNQSLEHNLTNVNINVSNVHIASSFSENIFCYIELISGCVGIGILFFAFEHRLSHLSITTQLFWMSCGGLFLSIPACLYTESINVNFFFDRKRVLLVLGHCFGASASLCMNNIGVKLIGGIRFTIIISITVVIELLVENNFLQNYEPGKGNYLEAIGVILVTVSMMLPGILELYRAKYMGPSENISDF